MGGACKVNDFTWPLVLGYGLWVMSYGLWVMGYELGTEPGGEND